MGCFWEYGGFWKVQLDVRDLGGHLDFTFRARAGTLSNRVREATLGVGIGLPFVNPGVCPSGQHLDSHWEGASSQLSASIPLGGALPFSGSCPLGWGTAWATVTTSPIYSKKKKCLFISLVFHFFGRKLYSFSQSMVSYYCALLGMLVAKWEPTPRYRDAYSVDTPKWACWEKAGKKHF